MQSPDFLYDVAHTDVKAPTILKRRSYDGLSLNSAFFGFYAHAGFCSGLKQIGFRPSVIAGSSSGALIGSLIAAGIDADDIASMILALKKSDFWEGNRLTQLLKPLRHGLRRYSGMLSGAKIRSLLEPYIGGLDLSDFRIPMGVAVSNLTRGIRELRKSGNAIDLILASMTFPILFEIPVIDGDEFLDGGVVDSEPIKEMILDPSIKRIIIHDIENGRPVSDKALLRAFNGSSQIIQNETRELKDLLARKYGKQLIRIVTRTSYIHPGDMSEGRAAFEAGRQSALAHTPYLAKKKR
ncbi:MAG: alpha/beta hydrolase [Spirochaetae bacterium HGW-Spirochaetae-10]|nr:MAG: alpha/beta hydrolase [Spirochaetae bacterium HGW-Spirochaetae-10]